jgi:hypothetical protein
MSRKVAEVALGTARTIPMDALSHISPRLF